MANNKELTKEEVAAINSLKRLAKKWPKTLVVFGSGGSTLSIRKPKEGQAAWEETEVAVIFGVRNDGGDGGDREHER